MESGHGNVARRTITLALVTAAAFAGATWGALPADLDSLTAAELASLGETAAAESWPAAERAAIAEAAWSGYLAESTFIGGDLDLVLRLSRAARIPSAA